jgi:hypothetical protein
MRKFEVLKMSGLAHTSASKLQKCPDADTYILVGFQGSSCNHCNLDFMTSVIEDNYFTSGSKTVPVALSTTTLILSLVL